MAGLTIRDLDDNTKTELRIRAARHGRSMEAEVRAILDETVGSQPSTVELGSLVHIRFTEIGGVDLELPDRSEVPRPAPSAT